MAKPTQAEIRAKADDWAKAVGAVKRAEATRDEVIAPYDDKIAKLQEKADAIETEILSWLDAQPKPIRLEGEKAFCELVISEHTTLGPRRIDVEAFVSLAKSQKKNPWPCVKVEVGKAEKLLGPKDIDAISTREEKTTVTRSTGLELK